jgi:hypothetical protein
MSLGSRTTRVCVSGKPTTVEEDLESGEVCAAAFADDGDLVACEGEVASLVDGEESCAEGYHARSSTEAAEEEGETEGETLEGEVEAEQGSEKGGGVAAVVKRTEPADDGSVTSEDAPEGEIGCS